MMSNEQKQKSILFWILLILMILFLIFVIKDCSNDSTETGLPTADEAINKSKDTAENALDGLNEQSESMTELAAEGGKNSADNVVDTASSAVKSITGVEQGAVLNAVDRAVESRTPLSGNDINNGANEVVSESISASITSELNISEGVLQGNIVPLLREDKLVSGKPYLAGTLHYRADKSTMSTKENAIMDAISQIANAYPDITIRLHGHTDTSGSEDANQKLSAKRASNAKKWLVKSGVSAQRISVYGHGSSQPMVSNATFDGRVQNRRTEIFIQK